MKRALGTLCALFGLVLLSTRQAEPTCDPVSAVTSDIADSIKTGLGGSINLSASFTTGGTWDPTCYAALNWAALSGPGLSGPASIATTDSAKQDTSYVHSWRPDAAGTWIILPYVTAFPDSGLQSIYSADTTTVIIKDDLWYPDALFYMGSFGVEINDPNRPQYGNCSSVRRNSGMLAYCPESEPGDPDAFTGTLFLNGTNGTDGYGGWVAQVTIPEPIIDPFHDAGNLNLAQYVQNFFDIMAGAPGNPPTSWEKWCSYNSDLVRPYEGDLFYIEASPPIGYNALYWTFSENYNPNYVDTFFIGRAPADFSDSRRYGLWHIGPRDGTWRENFMSKCDYLFAAPQAWADEHTGGRWLIAGAGTRESGTNGASRGPTMYAFNPLFPDRGGCGPFDFSGCDTSIVSCVPLLQYPGPFQEFPTCSTTVDGHYVDGYTHADIINDGAWIHHNGRQAIVFWGQKCRYSSHYKVTPPQVGCLRRGVCDEENSSSGWVCGFEDEGDASPAYYNYLLFYDPDDLIPVAQGSANLWDPQPYATMNLDEYSWTPSRCMKRTAGMAYDPTAGRIFLSELEDNVQNSDDACPIIHVFDIIPWEPYVQYVTLQSWQYVPAGDSLQFVMDWDLVTTSSCSFATDTTGVTKIQFLVADTTKIEVTAPFAGPPYTFKDAFPTAGIAEVKARLFIDNGGPPCSSFFDTNAYGVVVAP